LPLVARVYITTTGFKMLSLHHTKLLFSLALMISINAYANPDGHQVLHGNAELSRPAQGVLNITNTPGTIEQEQ